MHKLLTKIKSLRWELLPTLALLATSLIILPNSVSPKYFDSSAFPHILVLVICCTILSLALFLRKGFSKISTLLVIGISLLVITTAISVGLSGNWFSTLTGDTQRFTGAISLFSFLIILIYHTNLGLEKAKNLLALYLIPIFLVTCLGLLQIWNLISLPGAGGAGSTLGNIDFLSAWIGTTLPLFFFFFARKNWKLNVPILFAVIISIYVLIKLDVKQGILDLALTLIFVGGYLLRNKISSLDLGKKIWNLILGLSIFVWLELILLLPFQKASLPLIGNDPNLKIRTQYWIAGLKTWFSHLFFGVGPDNYGNYYQQYRTLSSVKTEELITSNDAHSALFQTLATLGIFGSLSFALIFSLVIIALRRNFKKYPSHHKLFYFLLFFLIVYTTNAMASPITLPHKFIFWAVLGLILGMAFTPKRELVPPDTELNQAIVVKEISFESLELLLTNKMGRRRLEIIFKWLTASITLVSIVSVLILAVAQFKFIPVINELGKNSTSDKILNYKYNNAFPCTYYYKTQEIIALRSSQAKAAKFALNEIKKNPRCVDARVTLVYYFNSLGEKGPATRQLQKLMEQAPANRQVLVLVGDVAKKSGDVPLMKLLHEHEVKLGYIK